MTIRVIIPVSDTHLAPQGLSSGLVAGDLGFRTRAFEDYGPLRVEGQGFGFRLQGLGF